MYVVIILIALIWGKTKCIKANPITFFFVEFIDAVKTTSYVPIRVSLSTDAKSSLSTDCHDAKTLRSTISSPSLTKTQKCVTNLRAALG